MHNATAALAEPAERMLMFLCEPSVLGGGFCPVKRSYSRIVPSESQASFRATPSGNTCVSASYRNSHFRLSRPQFAGMATPDLEKIENIATN